MEEELNSKPLTSDQMIQAAKDQIGKKDAVVIKEKQLTIFEKILRMQKEMPNIEKKGRNDHFKYDYIREEDLLEPVKTLLQKYNLTLMSGVAGVTQLNDGYIAVKTSYRIYDNDSDSGQFVDFSGFAAEKGDKAIAKAITGAMKSFLAKLLLIKSGEDGDKAEKQRKAKAAAAIDPYMAALSAIKSAKTPAEKEALIEKINKGTKLSKNQKDSLLNSIK